MISPKMREILRLFTAPDQQLDRPTIVKNCWLRYYHNADKYIGDILGRMVANGALERVKPGVFRRLDKKPVKAGKTTNPVVEDQDQLTLF